MNDRVISGRTLRAKLEGYDEGRTPVTNPDIAMAVFREHVIRDDQEAVGRIAEELCSRNMGSPDLCRLTAHWIVGYMQGHIMQGESL